MSDRIWRGALAVAATIVVAVLAAPHVGIERAQATSDISLVQADASPSVIQGGPPDRVALGGPWILRSDPDSHGQLKGWQTGAFIGSDITVPNAANAKRVTGDAGIKSFNGTVAWYATKFNVDHDGAYALRFESVNHKADVFLDGKELGKHTGTYLPFEYDVMLKTGVPHTLVVRADWRHPAEMKREAWHRTWFNFGGVNREVTIRPLAGSEITAPTLQTRLESNGHALVDLTAHLINHAAATRPLTIKGALVNGDQRSEFTFNTVSVPSGQTRVVKAQVDIANPKLWAPGSPNLYSLQLAIPGETSYITPTGLRQITKHGNQLLINGKVVQFRGASLQEDAKGSGDAMSAAQMDEVITELKAIGANATRSQHPLNPALLERLDAAGIMVWQGVGPVDAPGAWTSKTSALRAQDKRRVRTTFFQAQTHPSIIAWNLANEVAGNGHPGGQAQYIDQMAQELHQRDPGRLVALDVWGAHPPAVAGPMYKHIDAIGDTNYIGWYEDTLASRSKRRADIRTHITDFMKVFHGKIVMVTEFGAEANSDNPTNSPGGYEFQSNLLRDHINVYNSLPGLSGMLVWNLRDFAVAPSFAGGSIKRSVPNIKLVRGLNQKGLFTYDDRPKPAVSVVKQLYAAEAATRGS